MAEELRFDGKVMSGRITYTAGHWYLAVQVEIEHEEVEPSPQVVGVDLGIKHLAITSDGQLYDNVKALRTQKRKLARLQKSLSRKQKDSKNREKARAKVGKLHAKITNLRRDTIHKMTTDLAKQYGVIGLENLNVKGMMSNHKLAQAIVDASFGEIVRQLGYKAELNGGQIVLIDQWFPSSKTCSTCGHVMDEMPLNIRRWTCPACGSDHDRDINAAINIKSETLKMLEAT